MTSDMTFPKARKLALQGYFIRRRSWDGSEGGHALAWVSYKFGLYFYHLADVVRVVEAPDVTASDVRATDWTIDAVDAEDGGYDPGTGGETGDPEYPPAYEPPTGNFSNPNRGRGSGGGGSGGGNSGDGPEAPGGDGDGGGGGEEGGGSDEPNRPPKQQRSAPALSLSLSRLSGTGCIGEYTTEDEFSASVTLDADPDARPGEVWFLSIKHGSPMGTQTAYHGTIAPGDSQEATFTIASETGRKFGVTARAYLSRVGLETSDSEEASLRTTCPTAPTCPEGYAWSWVTQTCLGESGTVTCPTGWHYDSGTDHCVPNT